MLTNCQKDDTEFTVKKKTDNTLVFKNLLNKAKLGKELFNIVKKSSDIQAKGIDVTFEATYGVPTFEKTVNFITQDGKPILVIPLIDTNNEISNILIGFENEDTETFRVLNKELGIGEDLSLNSNKVDCSETGLNNETIGGVFKTTKEIIKYTDQENIASKVIVIDLNDFPDGCWGIDLECDCPDGGIGVYEIDCPSGGGGGSSGGSGSSDGGFDSGSSGSGSGGSSGDGGSGGSSSGGSSTNNDPCGDNPFDEIEDVIILDEDCDTSKEDLKKVFPNMSDADASTLVSVINDKGSDFGIDSDEDLWHFLSQAGHETDGFNTLNVTESTYWTTASKLAKTYTRFTTDSTQASTNDNLYYANDYLQNSSGVANVAMCCKFGNGNVASGDGYKYRGRGLFQLTWKDNYTAFKTWYNNKYDPDIDPVSTPSLIATNDTLSILSGLWYYKARVVDNITIDSTTTVDKVTIKINGKAKKGLANRKERFQKAKDSINCL